MESITSGLDKRQELLVSKLDNKIDGYVDKVVKKYEKLAEDKKTEAGNTTDATQKKKLQEEAKKAPEERQKDQELCQQIHINVHGCPERRDRESLQ